MPHLLAENNFITPPSEVEREKSDVTKNRKSENKGKPKLLPKPKLYPKPSNIKVGIK